MGPRVAAVRASARLVRSFARPLAGVCLFVRLWVCSVVLSVDFVGGFFPPIRLIVGLCLCVVSSFRRSSLRSRVRLCLFVGLFAFVLVCGFVSACAGLFCLFAFVLVCLFVCVCACLFVCLFARGLLTLFVRLFVCLFVSAQARPAVSKP